MAEKPNVTVIYQEAKPSSSGFGDVVRDLFFLAFLFLVAVIVSGGAVLWIFL